MWERKRDVKWGKEREWELERVKERERGNMNSVVGVEVG